MTTEQSQPLVAEATGDVVQNPAALTSTSTIADGADGATKQPTAVESKPPTTPTKRTDKPLPKEPAMTPRIKKKVPWKGKNIMVLLPRDDERGLPGKAPKPMRQQDIKRMFESWEELGYSVAGFDQYVDGFQPRGTSDSQSRLDFPTGDDIAEERSQQKYQVTLPDLNAWKNYVSELQEAKLRALGVSFAEEEPEPVMSPEQDFSRQPSVQHPGLPFSPPGHQSSASSTHGLAGYPFPQQFAPQPAQSPGIPSGASPIPFGASQGKFNPRQSISISGTNSPFQLPQQSPQWPNQANGIPRNDSPSMANFSGLMSPQSPFGTEGFQPGMHQRNQSFQYGMLPHQQLQHQQSARASPRLQEVRETDEDSGLLRKAPRSRRQTQNGLQLDNDAADYHLEESLRNQLEHDDYDPHLQQEQPAQTVPERFANEPGKPLVLHHPRPHSRGHSLSQNFFQDSGDGQANSKDRKVNGFMEKGDDVQEIETNPSNLGTPVQDFDFSAAFGQHQKTGSTASNAWNQAGPASGQNSRRPSHGSKPSLSKLNVQAPEFKFNPKSTFTPGLFNFTGVDSQPAVFQAGADGVDDSPPLNSVPQFGTSQFSDKGQSFSPGHSDFSFSTDGPKFRPDAPAFTPFQPFSASVTSTGGSENESSVNRASIFGNIDIDANDIVKPAKKSKAIPIVRPSSRSSAKSSMLAPPEGDAQLDADGRIADESRVKRARSAAPDGEEEPQFAQRPDEVAPQESQEAESGAKEAESVSAEGDAAGPGDTSFSSIASPNLIDTKATTVAPSETSPRQSNQEPDGHGEFDTIDSAQNFTHHGHEKSLSATAQPFSMPGVATESVDPSQDQNMDQIPEPSPVEEVVPEQTVSPIDASPAASPSPEASSKGLGASRFASPPPKPKGLAASRFAVEPTPVEEPTKSPTPQPQEEEILPSVEDDADDEPLIDMNSDSLDANTETGKGGAEDQEPTFEEIDAVMEHMEHDPTKGVNRFGEPGQPQTEDPASPQLTRELSDEETLSEPASPPPREYQKLPTSDTQPLVTTEMDDPFVDPPMSAQLHEPAHGFDDQEPQSALMSDWEAAFSEDEHDKLENRAQFFDGHVSELVGSLLASRLDPLEKTLFAIQNALSSRSGRPTSPRRELRSASGELQESDADDEDEEPIPRRSLSPRKDRKMEQIRIAVTEALAAQQRNQVDQRAVADEGTQRDNSALLHAFEELKQQFGTKPDSDAENDGLKSMIAEAVESRIPPQPEPDTQLIAKINELQSKTIDLEERLQGEQSKVEREIADRRAADDVSAELNRKLQAAETRVEVEIINRSVFDQRVVDLEDKLRQQEARTEEEVNNRRAAEDRLSENQRLLRISTEEENRLRDTLEEREQRVKSLEQSNGKTSMRMALLEAAQNNSTQSQSEMTNKVNVLEADLKAVRLDNNHWRAEAERADEAARHKGGELAYTLEENKHMHKSLSTLTTQLEENERLRESWRAKFLSLQEDMAKAAREVAEENARRVKKDQSMYARHEVLDARLQAEAKTRERLEVEMERLQMNERNGIRAVNECNRLEGMLGELRTDNHKLQQEASRYQREFEEARESGASEVKRTRMALQTELDAANHQVNAIRDELEEQNSKLRTELDNVKLEADTAKARNEMLLEEAETTKTTELEEAQRKHQNDLEDVAAKHERRLTNATEDGQKTEQHLLERLSLSSSKIEHLQDRIVHLEDKLEITKQAAAAAAQAAKTAGVEPGPEAAAISREKPSAQKLDVPEKISPQALRESIMVLQEQLQAREQRIEELEQVVAKSDPDAANKISKRDDEITWLRELLAVRHGDLQDIITALSGESYDRHRVRDASIRLKANLQMEQQERERAMNGASAINLPNIAQSLQHATPRVAQSIGAAWGNWRKGSHSSMRNISGVLSSPPSGHNATPSKVNHSPSNNLLNGLMTPPASGLRQPSPADNRPQPTAFSATGRRYPSQGSSSGRPRGVSNTSHRAEKMPATQEAPAGLPEEPETERPQTPPMMGSTSYDSDAQPGDFDDHEFFDDE